MYVDVSILYLINLYDDICTYMYKYAHIYIYTVYIYSIYIYS